MQKRILVSGNSAGLGGAQTAFRNFAQFLVRDGVEVGLLELCDGASGLPSELADAILYQLPLSGATLSRRLGKTIHTGRAAWLARRFMPDVFISVGLARTANLVARALRPSCFKIAHDFIYGRPLNDPLLNAAAGVFEAIGVQAPSMVTALLRVGFSARPVNWIPCLPEPSVIGCKKQPRPWQGRARLAYFGRLAPNKGLHLILEALAGLNPIPVTLDVWGAGPEAESLNARRNELGLNQTVTFLGGYPDGPDGARLMCEYDAIVLPSTGVEGLPLILLEAMAYGLPFLATDVGAVRDCCEGNADSILVRPQVEAVRKGLHEIVRKLIAQEFEPERLREYYRQRFGYAVMTERWRQCLHAPGAFFNDLQ